MDCSGCAKHRRRFWIGRLCAEAFTADHVRFVTLTYDDDHLDEHALNLNNEHYKTYCHGRRRKYSFRHFTVGEYGGETGRPHWHSLQFYYGKAPDDVLNFSTLQFGWGRGNSQYEVPRSVAGSAAYVYDYLNKGGKQIRPSPALGKQYLLNYARMQARNGRRLTDDVGMRYTVPNARSGSGKSWYYHIPRSHPWAGEMADAYIIEWDMTQTKPIIETFQGVNYGDGLV